MTEEASTAEAAKLAIDPGGQRVAGVYAQALLAAAEASNAVEATLEELKAVQSEVLDRHPRLVGVLASGFVNAEEKVKIIERTLSGRVAPVVFNFLRVLARHERLDALRQILVAARTLDDQRRGKVPVEVTTAVPLTTALAEKIKAQLRTALGGEPVLIPRINPELIGGVVLRVGDAVYDGSVAARLTDMRGRIINRSVHEIQSRRDRFRHPAGN